MGLPLLIHPDILFGFNIENAITTLSSPEASLCRKEGGEKEKIGRGARWEKEREKRGLFPSFSHLFPLPIVPPRACYISIRDTQREPLGRTERLP